jgi:hypothetical protein
MSSAHGDGVEKAVPSLFIATAVDRTARARDDHFNAGWIVTDIPPPPPETPIIFFLLAALAGAAMTATGYVAHRIVWPEHDPVALLLRLWH